MWWATSTRTPRACIFLKNKKTSGECGFMLSFAQHAHVEFPWIQKRLNATAEAEIEKVHRTVTRRRLISTIGLDRCSRRCDLLCNHSRLQPQSLDSERTRSLTLQVTTRLVLVSECKWENLRGLGGPSRKLGEKDLPLLTANPLCFEETWYACRESFWGHCDRWNVRPSLLQECRAWRNAMQGIFGKLGNTAWEPILV